MARTEGRIFTSIWRDDEFRALSFGAQWLYQTFLSQPDLSHCGVLPDSPGRWVKLATGLTVRMVTKFRDDLVASRFVMIDPDTNELLVRTLVRSDGALDSPNLTVSVACAFGAVHSDFLREQILGELAKVFPKGIAEGLAERLDEPLRKRFEEGKLKVLPKPVWERLPKDFTDAVMRGVTYSPSHPITMIHHVMNLRAVNCNRAPNHATEVVS